MNLGVLNDAMLNQAIANGVISAKQSVDLESLIQPSSIDLTLASGRGYKLKSRNPIPPGVKLSEFYKANSDYHVDLTPDKSRFLHKNVLYAFKLDQKLNLPGHLRARFNPKSSTGRVDNHVWGTTSNHMTYDNVVCGYDGELWVEMYPRSFELEMYAGTAVNQLRVMDAEAEPIKKEELLCLQRDNNVIRFADGKEIPFDEARKLVFSDHIGMTASITEGEIVGYVAKQNTPPIDLNRRDLPLSEFFDVVIGRKDGITINPGAFYLLNSSELIDVPCSFCSEMKDVETGIGEFRGHYAGFFDPGFNGQAVLELRNFGPPMKIHPGQVLSGLQYFRMKEPVVKKYGEAGNNYQGQTGPRPPKYFVNDINPSS